MDTILTSDHHPVTGTYNVPLLPQPDPGNFAPKSHCLRFTRLSGDNLVAKDVNGFSDPYIIFVVLLASRPAAVVLVNFLEYSGVMPPLSAFHAPELRTMPQAPFLDNSEKEATTTIRKKTLHPQWEDAMVSLLL